MSTTSKKRAAKIERIHDAAAALFARNGFYGTRMEDIAAGLDLQKGALYYYFDSKEALLASLVESRVGAALEVMGEIAARDATATDRLRAGFTGHLTVFQEHADLYTIFNTERLHSIAPEMAEKVNELGREYEGIWANLIREGIEAGEFKAAIDVDVTVKAILGACNTTLVWFRSGGRLTVDEVAAVFADLFLEGLAQ
ncbi:MAG: TetR/AcrR family transcriptional regulator [Actinobacteria bacterium]|nr:MAG: TetR/AcrR family transcriptional regulator [Actinomycetota bacterium]